jgi:hypothetical protein
MCVRVTNARRQARSFPLSASAARAWNYNFAHFFHRELASPTQFDSTEKNNKSSAAKLRFYAGNPVLHRNKEAFAYLSLVKIFYLKG